MREILIISGKGGTGKTSLTACFAQLAQETRKTVLCDLDVDAPDLHILLDPRVERKEPFISGHEARIDPEKCVGCGLCASMCRFDAIAPDGDVYRVDPLRCEGCKVCVAFCPSEAVEFPDTHCGYWYRSQTRFGPMAHAQLFPGAENSGKLVMLLKQQAREMAKEQGCEQILSDGAPGVGCPVISSLSGAHMAVLVTEPTPSGRHDLERVSALCDYFRIRSGVIINKCDLNAGEAERIEAFCAEKGYTLLGKLPYDPRVTEAMVARKTVLELPESSFSGLLREAWANIETLAGSIPSQKPAF
jgi:MinD superfamily P-loop ATPase